MLDRVTGAAPSGCPWRALQDDVVIDVVDLWMSSKIGEDAAIANVWRASLPAHLWDGLRCFDTAARAVVNNARERERSKSRG